MILRLGQAVGPLLLGLALVVGTIETVFYTAGGLGLLIGAGAVALLSTD
jgi:hypothetical protein